MFDSLSSKFGSIFQGLRSKGKIRESDLTQILEQMHQALLESDVAVSVVNDFIGQIKDQTLAELDAINKSVNPANQVFEIINRELIRILGGNTRRLRYAKKAPTIIMLAGLQGAGKTTLAGKLALHLKREGNTPILVAADLQRPNAVTQLQSVGASAGVPVYAPEPGNGVGDPVRVARMAITHAESKMHNIVIVDTAGRLGLDEEMMSQASAIRDALSPDEILFVVDAMVGQDAVRTASAFALGVGFDAVVLTKLDGDARGGAALSIAATTGKPIIFASTGEKLSDFDLFHPDRMASRILGLGDIQTLAEQAKDAMDGQTTAKLEEKFAAGEDFTLDDFLSQLEAMKKMGSLSKLLGMLPGANTAAMKQQLAAIDDNELTRTQSIVQSMTPAERRDVKILNGSRRARIAKGSGRAVSEVNKLVDRFTQAQKMMRQMRNGKGMPGMPGMPAMGAGMPKLPNKNMAPKKKSKSGNPAKRAAEEAK